MKEAIEKLVAEELARANAKFSPFNSRHEGAAVIREEIEEAEIELQNLQIKHNIFWQYVKHKGEPAERHYVKQMRHISARLAEEAIQVAAMCDKYMPLLEG